MKKFDKAEVLTGSREDEVGTLVQIIKVNGYELLVVEFDDGEIETFDPYHIQIITT